MKRAICALILAPLPLAAQVYFGNIADPYAATRVAPTGIGSVPVMPSFVNGPLQIGLVTDPHNAFLSTYAAQLTNGWIKVDPDAGSDSTCAVNTPKACATLTKALRSTVDSYVYFKCPASGIYTAANNADFDYRFTDAGYGNGVKALIANVPCKLRMPGDTIAANSWSATGGHAGTYQTAIACFGVSCGGVLAVQRTDQMDGSLCRYSPGRPTPCVDEWGNQFPARLYEGLPNQWSAGITYTANQYVWNGSYVLYQCKTTCTTQPPSSEWTTLSTGANHADWDTAGLATCDQLPRCQYFSALTGTLYVKLDGLDLTNPTNAAKITARYYPLGSYFSTGTPARVFIYGTVLYLENFYLDGIHIEVTQYNNSGSFVSASGWGDFLTIFNGLSYGVAQRGAALSVYGRTVTHANQADGMNSDKGSADGLTVSSMEKVYFRGQLNGDPQTYVSGITPGTAQVVNGESSHNGPNIDIAGFYTQDVGPEIADTSDAAVTNSLSWFVGTVARDISPTVTNNPGGFGQIGNSLDASHARKFWIENGLGTNENLNGTPNAIVVSTGAACKLYSAAYDTPINYASSSPCQPYTPDAP